MFTYNIYGNHAGINSIINKNCKTHLETKFLLTIEVHWHNQYPSVTSSSFVIWALNTKAKSPNSTNFFDFSMKIEVTPASTKNFVPIEDSSSFKCIYYNQCVIYGKLLVFAYIYIFINKQSYKLTMHVCEYLICSRAVQRTLGSKAISGID